LELIKPKLAQTISSKERYGWAAEHLCPGPILDAGCGNGAGTQTLMAGPVVGVDADKLAITEGAAFADRGNYLCAGLENGEWMKHYDGFKNIVCLDVIEHIKEDEKVMWAFAKTLPKGGRLLITTPNGANYLFEMWDGDDEFPHLRHYTLETLTFLVEQAGFKVLEVWHQPGEMQRKESPKLGWKKVMHKMVTPDGGIIRWLKGDGGLFLALVCEK